MQVMGGNIQSNFSLNMCQLASRHSVQSAPPNIFAAFSSLQSRLWTPIIIHVVFAFGSPPQVAQFFAASSRHLRQVRR